VHELTLASDRPAVRASPRDPRQLAFALYDLEVAVGREADQPPP